MTLDLFFPFSVLQNGNKTPVDDGIRSDGGECEVGGITSCGEGGSGTVGDNGSDIGSC